MKRHFYNFTISFWSHSVFKQKTLWKKRLLPESQRVAKSWRGRRKSFYARVIICINFDGVSIGPPVTNSTWGALEGQVCGRFHYNEMSILTFSSSFYREFLAFSDSESKVGKLRHTYISMYIWRICGSLPTSATNQNKTPSIFGFFTQILSRFNEHAYNNLKLHLYS